jgi:chromosome segregation ATPase
VSLVPAEELTRVLLSNQQKTNEMLTVVVKDVGGLDSKIAVLSTKLEERERIDREREKKHQEDFKELEGHIKEVEEKTGENTSTINRLKGGWSLILLLATLLSIGATLFTFFGRN